MRLLITLLVGLAAFVPLAAPAGTTSWSPTMGGAVRLLTAAGPADDGGRVLAGLHIRLEPGWKTYWRFPGDSGLPTSADFSGSLNVADAALAFPAPERHFDGFSTSIGYKDEVVLPIVVRLADPSAPALLKATVDYGVCKEVCVPARADLSLALAAGSPLDAEASQLIAQARARVPLRAEAGDPLSVVSVALGDDAPRTFTLAARLADPAAPADLFVEGPQGSYLTVPAPAGVDGDTATWTLPLDGLVHDGDTATLVLTLVNGDRAVEQVWPLSRDDLD